MKNKYFACLLIVLAASASNSMAATTAPQTIDPTLSFFTALAICAPGNYTERNDLGNNIGQNWLNQLILGQDEGLCNAVLTTPDDRSMQCSFPMDQLKVLLDQHFLQGILDSSTSDTSKEAVRADMIWSQLKTNYCSFANPASSR